MAVDLFLKINGVKGGSKNKAHFKEIDVLTWSLRVQNNGIPHSGDGAVSDKVTVEDSKGTKRADGSSPQVTLSSCDGTHFPAALLKVRKAGGEDPVEHIKFMIRKS